MSVEGLITGIIRHDVIIGRPSGEIIQPRFAVFFCFTVSIVNEVVMTAIKYR